MKVVPLTKNQVAIIDDEDFPNISKFEWYAQEKDGAFYAARGVARKGQSIGKIYLHHMILPLQAGLLIDHANGDTLDNRRGNLRLCTPAENSRNRRPGGGRAFKGVSLNRRTSRYFTHISVAGHYLYVGEYDEIEQAACAYNWASLLFFPEFTRLNPVSRDVLPEPPRTSACENCGQLFFLKTQQRRHCGLKCLQASKLDDYGQQHLFPVEVNNLTCTRS